MSKPRILCVDDEPNVVEGLQRILRKRFDVSTATSGESALEKVALGEKFAVVVSDMRMPVMNGATLLAQFRKRAPDTVRVLLTGQTDLDAAILAVNEGHLFRFLTKPCGPEALSMALDAAVEQHRLVTAERELLEQTLVGSVRALTEVLSLAHPDVFGPTARRHERARAVAEHLAVADAWHVEVASMLSAVGYVALPADVARKVNEKAPLDPGEAEMAARMPGVTERVLSHIPRLDLVREVLAHSGDGRPPVASGRIGPIGARILEIVADFSAAELREGSLDGALGYLRAHRDDYEPRLFEAMLAVGQPKPPEVRELDLNAVESGMILARDVKSRSGMLLVAQGQRVTPQMLERLRNFHARVGVVSPLLCEIPG